MIKKQPNIIYIVTDQHRYDCLGCNGNKILKTPNIDKLAQESINFGCAYTPSPVCAPARAAVFSGMYPPGCGVTRNWFGFNDGVRLLPEVLREHGYYTANIGKLHFAPHKNSWGFDFNKLNDGPISVYCEDDQKYSEYAKYLLKVYGEKKGTELLKKFDEDESQWFGGNLERFILGSDFIPEEHSMTTWTANQALEFLDDYDCARPLFLHLSFFGPHQPWLPPGQWKDMYNPADIELPKQFYTSMKDNPVFDKAKLQLQDRFNSQLTEDDYKQIIAYYYGNISMIDHYLGFVLDKLKEKKLWDDTLIIFSSDHGDHNGQYGLFFKGDMYDSAAKVALIVKNIDGKFAGTKCDKIVNTLGIYGTILDQAGCLSWKKDDVESVSFYDILRGKSADSSKGKTFSIIGSKDNNMVMMREENIKLIRLACGVDESPRYELYDMTESPSEVVNRFDDPSFADIRDEIKRTLDQWWLSQNSKYSDNPKDFCQAKF